MPLSTYDYLSNLDSLVFDSSSDVVQSDKDVADELDLWSNAKFTFDVKPGVGIFDEEKTKTNSPVEASACQFNNVGLDPVTYDTLVNYLDYELPRQQQEQFDASPAPIAPSPPVVSTPTMTPTAPTPKRIQPRPLAPALAPATPVSRQVLLPKPPVLDPVALASLLSQAAALAAASTQSTASSSVASSPVVKKIQAKRPREETPALDLDDQVPDEDKRRRNTAASARFRVKKKMREQAMEESVREMSLKSDHLQNRVESLESEIKFLRSLLLEKAEKTA
ncbi:hypothetical protein K501DRAFT_324149 [Backusella circina FSU 941]|nr:hypothetical protein K501DRAFT_324149 [Backusella circina FSU 941]